MENDDEEELHNYDVYPKVFLVGETVTITIKPLGIHIAFTGNEEVSLVSVARGKFIDYPARNN